MKSAKLHAMRKIEERAKTYSDTGKDIDKEYGKCCLSDKSTETTNVFTHCPSEMSLYDNRVFGKGLGTEKDNILSDVKNELGNSYLGVTEFGIQSEMPKLIPEEEVIQFTHRAYNINTAYRLGIIPEEKRIYLLDRLDKEIMIKYGYEV